jgi:hypothetical protein
MKTANRKTFVVDLGKRVFSTCPPIVTIPKLSSDISGFSTVPDLMDRLSDDRPEAFPYERELALYLLLIASVWPNDNQRLVTAARIFAGALNFHVSNVPTNRVFDVGGTGFTFHENFPRAKVEAFNDILFAKIGGPQSLLFSQSLEDFHRDLWKQVADLTIIHDVIEYIVKTSSLFPRISSLTFAYRAIADNIFARKGGYGIAEGPKRRRGKAGAVTTSEAVRAKCKRAPTTVILSFIMTRWYKLHFYDPANPRFFVRLSINENSSLGVGVNLSVICKQLLAAKSVQNVTIARWAKVDAAIPLQKLRYIYTLSSEELERAFEISDKVFKTPISQEERDAVREKLRTWGQQIPGT